MLFIQITSCTENVPKMWVIPPKKYSAKHVRNYPQSNLLKIMHKIARICLNSKGSGETVTVIWFIHFGISWHFLFQETAERCFTNTYRQKLIDLCRDVARSLQGMIRSRARENHVEELYNIELIPLTEELPKLHNVKFEDSKVKAVSIIILYVLTSLHRRSSSILLEFSWHEKKTVYVTNSFNISGHCIDWLQNWTKRGKIYFWISKRICDW